MIPKHTIGRQQAPLWQHELRHAYSRPAELLEFLELDPALPLLDFARLKDFPLRVPRGYAARMRKGDPLDPLFLQVWPATAEADITPGYTLDAVGDLDRLKDGGLIRKRTQGRALVIATGACAVNCRFCFRRHFPYSEALASRDHWQSALQQLAADPSIEEVILSGGDPLSLSDGKLSEFAEALEALPQIRRLRLHTRQPVVLPERVDEALLAWLGRGRLNKVVVLHVNHAQELDTAVERACRRLRDAGIVLLNQAVLLKGVNNSLRSQRELSERLFDCGVIPYYLHLLDRVQGVAHFETGEEEGASIMRELSYQLPGYLVPRLVREEAGAPAKTAVITAVQKSGS